MPDSADVSALCRRWLAQDKNPATRREIQDLQKAGSNNELASRLGKRIAFGTAGLRARMEAGYARMNDVTVIQASQGLCQYVLAQQPDARSMGVVIGHDHRHNSLRFAELTANVFIRAGVRVYLLQGLSCTPLVPFSVGRVKAAAGVMITASHNPAVDNGYKVYWSNGIQIIPPHDAGIAQSIEDHLDMSDDTWNTVGLRASDLCLDRSEELQAEYMASISRLCLSSNLKPSSKSLNFVYTPMHGVGLPFAKRALTTIGFPDGTMDVVNAQAEPNPNFPTVKFPNPEEKGALDKAIEAADDKGVSLICANDPDADRFCAAEKTDGQWRIFTGDQIGVMFGVWLFRQYKAQGKPLAPDPDKLAMLASTVSSKMLAVVAKAEGFHFYETLTGFKWLGNKAQELNTQGYTALFAYEEAIGFMVSSEIRDKDGISALAVFACMADKLYSSSETLSSYLDSLYTRYGQFGTLNSYWICRSPDKIRSIFDRLRKSSAGASYPETLGQWTLSSLRDITQGYDSQESDRKLRVLPMDASGQMLSFSLNTANDEGVQGLVGTIRTSGTEPKIKYYLEGWGADHNAVQAALEKVRNAIAEEWMHVVEESLEGPA